MTFHDTKIRDTTGESANRIGRAGEHVVCAELLMAGYECFLAEGKAPYDIIADVGGRLVRLQVKTTSGVRLAPQRINATPAYTFSARHMGKMQRIGYKAGQADLVAYVALDRRIVAYLPAERIAQSAVFRLREYDAMYVCKTGMFIDDFPLAKALEGLA